MQESETPTLCKDLKKRQENEVRKQDAGSGPREPAHEHAGPATLAWPCHPAPLCSSLPSPCKSLKSKGTLGPETKHETWFCDKAVTRGQEGWGRDKS